MRIYSAKVIVRKYSILVTIHSKSDNDACANGIHSVIIAQLHSFNDRVKPVNAAVRSHSPQYLILHPRQRTLVRTFRHHDNMFATHGAAAATYDFCYIPFVQHFTAYLVSLFEVSIPVIPSGHTEQRVMNKNVFNSAQSSVLLRCWSLH